MPNLEAEVNKLADKEGWITLIQFIKFALPTDLCKLEFHDKVFHKEDKDDKKTASKKESKPKKVSISIKYVDKQGGGGHPNFNVTNEIRSKHVNESGIGSKILKFLSM